MQITTFEINNTRTAIDLTLTDALTVDKVYIFDNDSYKDYDKAVDVSDKLLGTATENLTITLSDLQIPEFSGLYFVEVITTDSKHYSDLVLDTVRYDECILDKLLELPNCESCLNETSVTVTNSFNFLAGLQIAVKNGFIQEALNIIRGLDKYCSNKCKTCGPYTNINNNDYYAN